MTNLEALRINKRLTTQALGKAAGVSGATIRNLERGRSNGQVETLGKLGDYFDVDPAILLLPYRPTPAEEAA